MNDASSQHALGLVCMCATSGHRDIDWRPLDRVRGAIAAEQCARDYPSATSMAIMMTKPIMMNQHDSSGYPPTVLVSGRMSCGECDQISMMSTQQQFDAAREHVWWFTDMCHNEYHRSRRER